MENKLPPEAIQEIENHKTDLKTLWNIYGGFSNGLFRSIYFKFSFLISLSLVVLCLFIDGLYSYTILKNILEKVLSILPNIIGFNIGAYALIIGFGQKNIVDKLSVKPKSTSKYTLFQEMGATFAFSVLVQSLTITISFIVDFFIENLGMVNLFHFNNCILDCINGIVFFLILFMTIYSFVLIPKIVLNVFAFSQLYHFYNKQDNNPDNI